jgi:uncharacterized protein
MASRIAARVKDLMRKTSSPQQIALGFTFGLTLSMLPVPFVGMAAGLGLAALMRSNLVSAYLGSAVMNPLTGPFIFFAELWLGLTICRLPVPSYGVVKTFSAGQWLEMLRDMLGPFGIGIAAFMLASVALGYPLAFVAAKVLLRRYAHLRDETLQ